MCPQAYTDYSDSVSRRMGFIPLPLALLVSLSSALCCYYKVMCKQCKPDVMFFFAPVDQSSDQLSENPGFTLLHVCVAVLFGVNMKFPSFACTSGFSVFLLNLSFALVSLKVLCVRL